MQDTEGPSFDNVPMDVTIACGDLNHIPAMPEDCAGVDLSFTQTVAEEGCSPHGLIVRTYTAVDGCGNESTFLQTLHTVDDEAPVVALDEVLLDMSCGMYSEDNDYGLTVSDCSLQAWAESDGIWTESDILDWSLASDTVDSEVEVSWVDTQVSINDEGPCYTIDREVTAVDRCGNTCVQLYIERVGHRSAHPVVVVRV